MADARAAPRASGPIRVSVIVVDSGSAEALDRCLASLKKAAGGGVEVVVTRHVRRAIAAATGEYVAVLASHCVASPDWLTVLLAALASDPAIAAASPVLRWNGSPGRAAATCGRMTWLGFPFDIGGDDEGARLATGERVVDSLYPFAAGMVMSRRDWESSGGFDPAFSACADVDLGWRLRLIGRRVVVCRDSIVSCDGSRLEPGSRTHPWSRALELRETTRMVVKHYPPRFLLRVLWRTFLGAVRRGAWRPLLGAGLWNAALLPGTLLRRRAIQRQRQLAHEELFRSGLLVEIEQPPPAAPPPAAVLACDFDSLIVSNVLLPGHDSALGRLGEGWRRAEGPLAQRLRWTAGPASCTLKVAPGAAGRLWVVARRPHGLTVTCNGAEAGVGPDSGGWSSIELPVQSDAGGLLAIRLDTPMGSPSAGCAVREIRFVPDSASPASAPPASISVIIPTYNRWPILADALAALAGQTLGEFEVIVVDDGSTDGTWERLLAWGREHPEIALKPVRQANLKPGRARNNGLCHATGDLVLFIGDDTIPAPDLLAQHLAKHREVGETIGVLGFTDWDRARMTVTPFLDFINLDGQQFAYGHFEDGCDLRFTNLYTSNISLPRWVLGDDPFHPAFTFVDWEDTELGYRLSVRGLRLVYHAAARAAHVHPSDMRRFYRRQEHVGRTVGVLLGLHPELVGSDAIMPLRPPPWYGWARLVVPLLLPLLDRWDRWRRSLPPWLYRDVLMVAFWTGRRQALAAARRGNAGQPGRSATQSS